MNLSKGEESSSSQSHGNYLRNLAQQGTSKAPSTTFPSVRRSARVSGIKNKLGSINYQGVPVHYILNKNPTATRRSTRQRRHWQKLQRSIMMSGKKMEVNPKPLEEQKKMEEETQQNTGDSEPETKVMEAFSNHLVVANILKCLDHTSAKVFRGCCQTINSLICSNRDFINRTEVKFHENGFYLDTVDTLNFPWTNLSIYFRFWNKQKANIVQSILRGVETLELNYYVGYDRDSDDEVHSQDEYETLLPEALVTFLLAAKTLRTLNIPYQFLCMDIFQALKENSQLRENLQNLESLCITNNGCLTGGLRYEKHVFFQRNIEAMIGIEFKGLKSFSASRECLPSDCGSVTAVRDYINLQRSTLRTLAIWDAKYWDAIMDLNFPVLKELTVLNNGDSLTKIVTFLKRHASLEFFELELDGPTESGRPLFEALQLHQETLKTFSLTWKLDPRNGALYGNPIQVVDDDQGLDAVQVVGAQGAPVDEETEINYSFLRNFRSLKCIKIHQVRRSTESILNNRDLRASPGSIMSSLPDEVRKIDLAGAVSGVWAGDTPQSTMESLGRFRHLTVLYLIQCPAAIDDEILHFICSNLTQLREFGFSHCDRVTDVGMKGLRNDDITRLGIASLTGLKKLRIYSCNSLTPEGLIASLSFPDLKELTLGIESQMGMDFYSMIVRQNRFLETLSIYDNVLEDSGQTSPDLLETLPELQELLKTQSPRFQKLEYIDSIPPNLIDDDDDESGGSVLYDGDDFSFPDYYGYGFTSGDSLYEESSDDSINGDVW